MCEGERESEKYGEIKTERGVGGEGGGLLCASSAQEHLNVTDILVTPVFPSMLL